MTETMAPDGLVPALRSAGLTLAGPVGRGSGGARWSAVDARGRRWTVTPVQERSARHGARLRERLRRLSDLRHDHLAQHGGLLELPDGTLAVLQEEIPGADLATVCAARGAWAPAEVVTVLVPLAGALAALHGAGLTHGDVSAANVILRPDGRAMLVDLVGGDDPAEAGTPGVAAPERPAGADAPGDVHALARLGLQLLGQASPAGADACPGESGGGRHDELVGCLQRATASDPAHRPGADVLAAELYDACLPAPVQVPDAAVLARAALRRLAESPDPDRTTRVRPRPARERGRHRRRRGRRTALGLVGVLVALGMATGGVLVGRAARAPADGQAAAHDPYPDPVDAAVGLTLARADALAAGDLWALRQVTVPGSRAARADLLTARALGTVVRDVPRSAGSADGTAPDEPTQGRADDAAHGVRPRDAARVEILLVVRLPTVRPAAPAVDAACPRCVRVLVSARFGDRTDDAGAAHAVQSVVLVLRPTSVGWRVSDVERAAL